MFLKLTLWGYGLQSPLKECRRLGKWKYNTKMVPKEMGVGVMYWTELA